MEAIISNIPAMLSDADPDVRRLAIEQLESMPGPGTRASLARALRDNDQGVRDAAANALRNLGGEETAHLVVEYITDPNIVLRNLAGAILIRLGSTAVPALLLYLKHHDQDVRKFAVDLLGAIREPHTADAVIPLLEDVDSNVVVSAAEALGNIGNPTALPALMKTYRRHDYARAVVLEAIGKIADPTARSFVEEIFQHTIHSPQSDPLLLFTLFEAMGGVGGGATVQLLQSHLQSLTAQVRRAATKALVQISVRTGIALSPESNRELRELLSDDDRVIVQHVVHLLQVDESGETTRAFLATLGRQETLDSLLVSVLVQRTDSLHHAVTLLEDSSTVRRVPLLKLLVAIASDRNCRAVQVLYQSGGEALLAATFDALCHVWPEGNEEERSLVVDALFLFDGERAVAFLRGILSDSNPWLRTQMVEQLSKVTHTEAEHLLVKFLQDEDEMVRDLASTVLLQRGYSGGDIAFPSANRPPLPPSLIVEQVL